MQACLVFPSPGFVKGLMSYSWEVEQMHLLVDGYGGEIQKMKDEDSPYPFLDTYPSEIWRW